MAYYSGQASNYQDLQSALVNACVEQGWAWLNGVLSKGNAFVRPFIQNTPAAPGLCIQGGTGQNGSSLINGSVTTPRLGRHTAGYEGVDVVFPCTFNIHINTNPEEVYLIVNFNIDQFYYLAFGLSNINLPGTGLWLGATACGAFLSNYGWAVHLNQAGLYNGQAMPSGLFFCTMTGGTYLKEVIHTGLNLNVNATGWQETIKGAPDIQGVITSVHSMNLLGYLPSKWSDNTVLLPIQVLNCSAAKKTCLVADLKYARYTRIDNLEPNQIIFFGNDKWKIYPFYKKNSVNKDGGSSIQHSGTFGWAVKYDGP